MKSNVPFFEGVQAQGRSPCNNRENHFATRFYEFYDYRCMLPQQHAAETEGVKALYKSTAVRCVEIRLFTIPTFYER